MKARYVILGLAFLVAVAVAKPEGFPRGQVVSRVDCAGPPGQSYALYLPTNYGALKKWPAIFAFDPMGQGSRPAGLLQPAAEKYGYIVVASNNSRNGPVIDSVEAMQAVWIDSRARFSIDDKRIYAVGFSGGARTAMRFGLSLSGRVRGVLPAGGGLPPDMEVKSPPSFAVYGIVGIRDFNYGEMKDLDRRWAGWGVPHHLEVTEQEHRWPSQEAFLRGIEWMELQAIKSGSLPPNAELLGALFAARLGRVRELRKAGNITAAYLESESVLQDFQGLCDVSEAEAWRSELQKSADINKLLKREKKREAEREQLDARLTARLGAAQANIASSTADPAALRKSINALDIDSLRREAQSGKDEDRRIVAVRQIQRILVVGFEDANFYFGQQDPRRALKSLEVAALGQPQNPEIQFLMARTWALDHDERNALKALAKAAELGFSSPERIEREPAFAPLRQDPRYAETLAKIRAHSESGNH